MLPNDAFQRMLYDLFCLWHDVRRHYEQPTTMTPEEKMLKIRSAICRLLSEIDGRVERIKSNQTEGEREQSFYEEWTMLTWNVLCITSRLASSLADQSTEDRLIFERLNRSLVDLVNYARDWLHVTFFNSSDQASYILEQNMTEVFVSLHSLYRQMNHTTFKSYDEVNELHHLLKEFFAIKMKPVIEMFKQYCISNVDKLWREVRSMQIQKMRDQTVQPDLAIAELVRFYSRTTFVLAVLAARIQGFRYDLAMSKQITLHDDPLLAMSEAVFSALELLMSECILANDPSGTCILVTNNLFGINCGALARGVVFKDFEIQIVSEETAEQIQAEMRKARMLCGAPAVIPSPPSAALLAMKQTAGTKRPQTSEAHTSTAHKKSDVNSKEKVVLDPMYNAKNRYWGIQFANLLCTTRQKGRASHHNSYQDLSPGAPTKEKNSEKDGKRPIFYCHITATLFSPSGRFSVVRTLSLPFTIATRRNQDCQVQRMMSSYTATIFWLYGCHVQDGLLLQWFDQGMPWDQFKHLYKQHFKTNAGVARGLVDQDFQLLQYKLQCQDCAGPLQSRVNGVQRIVTFKNILCPHFRYECGSTNVRFSVWRGMLELLQIFHDQRNNVRKLWEHHLLLGFLEFDEVEKLLATCQSTLIMRLSYVTGGTICFTVKTDIHSSGHGDAKPLHLEPLDLKKLQGKCLRDYLLDISAAEKVKYILNANHQLVKISDVIAEMSEVTNMDSSDERNIFSNVTHSGDLEAMQQITFTAMRIAVVTCKVKPPSADAPNSDNDGEHAKRLASALSPSDDFARELTQLCNFHGRSKQEALDLLESLSDVNFVRSSSRAVTSFSMSSTPTVQSPLAPLSGASLTMLTSPIDDITMEHNGFKFDYPTY